MDENNDRRDLYEQFEAEVVKRGNSEAFFDEEELVEIFDYASDYDNFIVKMEVLIYGAVHYPGNEALATRRAWLYYSLGDVETTTELNKRVVNKGTLNRLLDLRAENGAENMTKAEVEKALAEILADTADFEDEEIIQFTDYALEQGLADWLMKNKELIISKCPYPQTFLYEFAVRAESDEDLDTATSLFEELTMLEPFTLDFWVCLATVQLENEKFEEALASADYALAIDPDSIKPKRIKATALFRLGRDIEEVTRLYYSIVTSNEVGDSDVSALAISLADISRTPEAIEILKGYLLVNPNSRSAVNTLLYIDFEAGAPYLKALIESDNISEAEMVEWIKVHVVNDNVELGAFMFLLFHSIVGIKENFPLFFEVLYISELFDKIIEIFRNTEMGLINGFDPALTIPYIMSLVRTDHRDEALKEAEAILSQLRKYRSTTKNVKISAIVHLPPPSAGALFNGFISMIENIIRALKAPDTLPADDFDPITT